VPQAAGDSCDGIYTICHAGWICEGCETAYCLLYHHWHQFCAANIKEIHSAPGNLWKQYRPYLFTVIYTLYAVL